MFKQLKIIAGFMGWTICGAGICSFMIGGSCGYFGTQAAVVGHILGSLLGMGLGIHVALDEYDRILQGIPRKMADMERMGFVIFGAMMVGNSWILLAHSLNGDKDIGNGWLIPILIFSLSATYATTLLCKRE